MDRIRNDEGKIWTHGDTLNENGGDHHVRQSSKGIDRMEAIGERLIMARFNSKYTKLTVIMCCAPIEEAEEAKQDVFYYQLQQVIQEVPSHVLCVI